MYQLMYVVIDNKAIAIDELGQPIICDMVRDQNNHEIEWVDWDSEDVIDWMDLSSTKRDMYKKAIDFLQVYQHNAYYVK